MRKELKNKKIWTKPELVKLGRLGDVAGTGSTSTQLKMNGTCCNPGVS